MMYDVPCMTMMVMMLVMVIMLMMTMVIIKRLIQDNKNILRL